MNTIANWQEGDEPLLATVKRGDETLEVNLTPVWSEKDQKMIIGVEIGQYLRTEVQPVGFLEGFSLAWNECVYFSGALVDFLTTENEFIGKVQPYMPVLNLEIDFAAWYTCTTQQDHRIKIEAIYFNTDSLMLYTTSKFYTQKDGRKPSYSMDIGKYIFTEGDYNTGKATLTLSTGVVYDAIITDGQMSVMNNVFIKQDNDTIPEPMSIK